MSINFRYACPMSAHVPSQPRPNTLCTRGMNDYPDMRPHSESRPVCINSGYYEPAMEPRLAIFVKPCSQTSVVQAALPVSSQFCCLAKKRRQPGAPRRRMPLPHSSTLRIYTRQTPLSSDYAPTGNLIMNLRSCTRSRRIEGRTMVSPPEPSRSRPGAVPAARAVDGSCHVCSYPQPK